MVTSGGVVGVEVVVVSFSSAQEERSIRLTKEDRRTGATRPRDSGTGVAAVFCVVSEFPAATDRLGSTPASRSSAAMSSWKYAKRAACEPSELPTATDERVWPASGRIATAADMEPSVSMLKMALNNEPTYVWVPH